MYSFPIWNQSVVPCLLLTFFLICMQISEEASQIVWYSHLLKNFPQFVVIYTVKDFGIINKAEVDVFLEFSCFFYDPMYVGNLISGSSGFYKSSFSSVVQLCPTLCDPMDCSTPGLPVHQQLPELSQTHVHGVGDAI